MSVVAVGDIAEQVRGISYPKSDATTQEGVGLVPILRANNISETGLAFTDLVYVPKKYVRPHQYIRRGDVVIAASSGSIDVVGKAGALRTEFDGSFGAFCKVLRPNQKRVDPVYFSHFFKTVAYRRKVSSLAAGANINNLKNEHLDDLLIPLPPLEEQKRIAAILDKADQLRQKRRQAIALLDSLTQSIFLEMFGDPVSNPKRLPKKPLGELIKVSSGNGLTSAKMDPSGVYPVYGGNGINGKHSAYMFDDPQIAIGRVGVYCGAVHVTKPKSWITDNALFVSKNLAGIRLKYLAEALRMANLNQYAGRAAQPLISGSRIYPVEILLPTEEKQIAFENALLAAETTYRQNYKSQERIDATFSSLQHRAFSGQL